MYLKNLTTLDLSANPLNMIVPDAFDQLTSLIYLSLSNTLLTDVSILNIKPTD
jgi:Leucine-rich repeat (LRR) protein